MKDYRRPVDYHNERLQESEIRRVSRPPTQNFKILGPGGPKTWGGPKFYDTGL